MAQITNGIIPGFRGEMIYCLCVMWSCCSFACATAVRVSLGKVEEDDGLVLSSLGDDGMDFCLDVPAGGKWFHAV